MRSFTFSNRKLLLAVFLSLFTTVQVWAQCPSTNTFQFLHTGSSTAGITPATFDDPVFAHGTWAGHYVRVNVVDGETYDISLVGSQQRLIDQFGSSAQGFPDGVIPNFTFGRPEVDHDPMITLYDDTGAEGATSLSGGVVGFNLDASPTENLPELEYTATYTGILYVAIDLQPGTTAYNTGLGPPNVQTASAPADCSGFHTDSTSLSVTRIIPVPQLTSAVLNNSTQITASFNKNVQTNGSNPTDFTVIDGIGTSFVVSAQVDGTVGDTDIVLTLADVSTAIGDLTVTYTNNNSEITDFDTGTEIGVTGSVVIDTDSSPPTLSSASKDTDTQITVTFSEAVQTNGTNPTDFVVTDDNAANYTVSAQMDGTANDNQVVLTVADLSGATAPITLTYTNNNDEITDFGSNSLATDGTGVTVSLNPKMISAAKGSDTEITVTFDQYVQTNATNPTDFTVTDGQGTDFAVSAQVDGTAGDTDIVLTVADLSASVGDLTVKYTNNNNEISDAATGTKFAETDATGVIIDTDATPPTLASAVKDTDTQITVTFSEAVQTNGTNPTDFTVSDGQGNGFTVSAQMDGAANDENIVLTVADLSTAVGDLIVTYTNNNNEIRDFGGNATATDGTGVNIDLDMTSPTLGSAVKNSDTQVTVTFSEQVQTNEMNPTDFTVEDGAGNDFAVSAQVDGTPEDTDIVLTVADLSTVLGDLIITYVNNNDEVTDFGGNSLATNATGITIDLDNTVPTLVSSTKDSETQITLTLSEAVQTNGTNPTDFVVVDGMGSGFAVNAQAEGTAEDAEIVLTVADLSMAVGDLVITYTDNNDEITDFGGNSLATNGTGVSIDTDATVPMISSATKDSDTQITLTLSEKVQTVGTNPTDFTVTDGIGIGFVVSTQSDGTANDDEIVLTVADLSSAVGTLTISYTNNNNEITDFGGNSLATDATGVTILLEGNFRIQWNAADAEVRDRDLLILTDNDLTYDYNVIWGDGTFDSNQSGNVLHNYVTDGTYTIIIEGTFPRFMVGTNDEDYLGYTSLDEWGTQVWSNLDSAFLGAENLVYNATDAPNLSNINSLAATFQLAKNLGTPDLTNWDVSGISSLERTFSAAINFNGDVTTWNVSNVTNMDGLFSGAVTFNQDVGNWIVSNVTNMQSTFSRNYFYLNEDRDMQIEFEFIDEDDNLTMVFNQDITGWNVGNVTNFSFMFSQGAMFNQAIDMWDVSSATDMNSMFNEAVAFNQNLNSWDVSLVTDMSRMFRGTDVFNGNISSWDVSDVIYTYNMFANALVFNTDISGWDVGSVIDMEEMFDGAVVFNQNITGWDVSSVTDFEEMFEDTDAFNQPIGSWNVLAATDVSGMFLRATGFNQDISAWDVSNVTDMSDMFEGNEGFNQDISGWDVSNVTTMEDMFKNNKSFNQPIGVWDVSSVESMEEMFSGSVLFNQDISSWNVALLEEAEDFLTDAEAFRQVNWDNALIAWASLPALEEATITASVGYCTSETARQTLIDTHGWDIDDAGQDCPPTLASAEVIDHTTIEVTFNEALNTNEGNPTDFTVTDAAGTAYVVSAQVDGTDDDAKINLTVADLSQSSGALTIAYTNNNNELFDDAFNFILTNATGVIAPDVINPGMLSGTRDSDTQLTITFNEPVTTAGTNPGDFTVVDSDNTNFPVTGLTDGTAGDNELVLTLAGSITSAEVSLTITYVANNVDEVQDIAGNDLQTDGTGIAISLAPIVTAVSVSPNNAAIGNELEVQVTFSRAVDVTGSPTITVTVGSADVTASTVATTNATQVNFNYTIQEGDEDTEGIALADAIQLNGGTIIDSDNSLVAILDLENVEDLSGKLVDGVRPTLTIESIADDTGSSSTDLVTNDNSLFVNGTSSESTQQVTLFVDGTEAPGTPVTESNGDWQFSPIGEGEFTISEGVHTISATIEDAFGNESTEVSVQVTVDQTAPDAPTINLSSATDLGQSNADNLTSGSSFTLKGTAEANSTIAIGVQVNGTTTGVVSTSANSSGIWEYDAEETFSTGAYTFIATATDLAGNESSVSESLVLNFDQESTLSSTSPEDDEIDVLPNANLTATFDEDIFKGSGNLTIKKQSDDSTFETIDVSGSNVTVEGTTVTIDPVNFILPSDNEFYINIDNGAFENEAGAGFGGISDNSTWSFTIIAASVVTSVAVPDADTYAIGENLDFTVTMVLPVSVTGGTPSIPLTIGESTVNATLVGTVTDATSLVFRYTVEEDDLDTDGVGIGATMELNGATMQDEFDVNAILDLNNVEAADEVLVDGIRPTAPTISGISEDTGASSNDQVTNDQTLIISGTAEANSTVKVSIDGSEVGSVIADEEGDWSYDATGVELSDGVHSFTTNATDGPGNVSDDTSLSVTIDTMAPSVPSLALDASSDLGQSDTDNLTADSTPAFSGSAEADATIEIFVGGTSAGTTDADENGSWSLTLSTSLADGEQPITATATDAAGNTSTVGEGLTITINSTFGISSLSPADDEIDVLPNVNLSVTFDENIFIGTGNLVIKQATDDEVVESIDITSSQVTITDATATIDPSVSILPPDTELYVTIEAGAFQNAAGAEFTGISNSDEWSFIIIPAPVVTEVTVPEDGTYIVGENLDFTVSFTLPVFISGSPSIPITIGENTVEALLNGTVSNSNTATFRYTVVEGDLDVDGIAVGVMLSLNGGSIQDEANVDAILSLFNIGATANVSVDGVLPEVATITGISDDTGRSGADQETSDAELIYSGTAESNGMVALFIDGTALGMANVDDSGNWTYDATSSALAEGNYSITTRVTDAAGNTGAESESFVLIVDQSAPEAPIVDLSPASDSGISDADDLTNDVIIVLQGTAEANSNVTVVTPNSTQTTTADEVGNWTLDTGETLVEGTFDYTATATDVAGNVSVVSTTLTIVVDLSLTISSTAPTSGSTAVVVNESLLFTFDQNVNKSAGNLEIYLTSDNSLVASIDVTDTRVLVDGPMILFNPENLLAPEASTFYVIMDEGILTNDAGHPFAGINDETTYTFTTIGDSDQDGVPDLDEDTDNNGELDDDTDGDGILDYLDTDDDGDGLLTSQEDLNADGDLFNEDTDGDGIPNFRDSDDDGDGIETIDEDFNRDGDYGDDNDNDGIPDYLDDAIIPDEENIPQGLSPDGDGANDIWRLPEIESHPNNRVTIFNRWGSLVFETTGYDNASNAFAGASNSGSLPGADMLPDGTYYYVVDFGDGTIRKGFLVIKQ